MRRIVRGTGRARGPDLDVTGRAAGTGTGKAIAKPAAALRGGLAVGSRGGGGGSGGRVPMDPKRMEKVVVATPPTLPAPRARPGVSAPPVTVKPAIIRRVVPVKPKAQVDYYVKLDDEPIETGIVIRVGLDDGQVPADVILGPDGRARAIRLVNDFSGEQR